MKQLRKKLKQTLTLRGGGSGPHDGNRSDLPSQHDQALLEVRYGLTLLKKHSSDTNGNETAYDIDVVAIHGLNGHPLKTWKHSDGTLWLRDLLPGLLPGANVYTYGYPSEFFNKFVADVEDFALHLLDQLQILISQDQNTRPIIYVCHSLGGIVLKSAMILAVKRNPEVWHRSKGIMFFGTPHRGSMVVPIAQTVSRIANLVMGGTLRTDLISYLNPTSQQLKDVADDFTLIAEKFLITTFYENEGVGLFKTMVVDKTLAQVGVPHEKISPILRDHREMCRFSKDDSLFKSVAVHVREMAEQAIRQVEDSSSSLASSSSFNSTDKHCLEQLGAPTLNERPYLARWSEGTLGWFVGNELCTSWLQKADTKLLWVTGYAGCGKTTLSNYMIQHLSENLSPKSIICQFFCSGEADQQQYPVLLIRSLLYQIVTCQRRLVKIVKRASESLGSNIFRQFDTLWNLLTQLVQSNKVSSINIIIDAIDECQERTQRLLVERIALLIHSSLDTPIKFFITSRPHGPAIDTIHRNSVSYVRLKLEDHHEFISRDVNLLIEQSIDLLVEEGRCGPELRDAVVKRLVEKAEGTFLWVALVLSSLEKSRILTARNVLRIIQQIPPGLSNLYKKFLHDISPIDRELASNVLSLIITAVRPLNSKEIEILLRVHPSDDRAEDDVALDSRSIELLLDPFVQAKHSEIHLVHHSVKEFLLALSKDAKEPLAREFGVDPAQYSFILAQSCMDYLLNIDFDVFSENDSAEENSPIVPTHRDHDGLEDADDFSLYHVDLEGIDMYKEEVDIRIEMCQQISETYKLFDYAARYWITHLMDSENEGGPELRKRTIQLCDPSTLQLHNWFRYYWSKADMDEAYPKLLDTLVVASFFGLSLTASDLLRVPGQNFDVGHALFRAAQRGHVSCVEEILEHLGLNKLDIASSHHNRLSPLAVAAQNGHLNCVRSLLKRNIFDLNEQDRNGRTPISLAAANAHGNVVSELLSNPDLLPDTPDRNGFTAIFWAVATSSEDAVSYLLRDDRVDHKHTDNQGRNVLSWAASDGLTTTCRLLMHDQRIDINNADINGITPLMHAVINHHQDIVELLVRKRAKLSVVDKSGRNAISWASEGIASILSYLIRKHPEGVDVADIYGWTPLAWALNTPGYYENVSLLLESGLVDINRSSDQSPLFYTVSYGYIEITRLIFHSKGVDVNLRNEDGRTPLSCAVLNASTEMVQLLLQVPGIDVNAKDHKGESPLSLAMSKGRDELVQLLLDCPGIILPDRKLEGITKR